MLGRKILLAYDGSEGAAAALDKTIKLAKADPDVQVCVIYVVQPSTVAVGEAYVALAPGEQAGNRQQAEALAANVEREISVYASCTVDLIPDRSPSRAIVATAEQNGCDLIVIGSRGLSGIKKFFLGSVSAHVVQHATVSVLVAR